MSKELEEAYALCRQSPRMAQVLTTRIKYNHLAVFKTHMLRVFSIMERYQHNAGNISWNTVILIEHCYGSE
jgi:hypothetical protein